MTLLLLDDDSPSSVSGTRILGVEWFTEMAAEFAGDFRDATLDHATSSTLDDANLNGPPILASAIHTCKALAFSYRREHIDGTSVLEGDFRAIVLRGTIDPAVTPSPGDTLSLARPASTEIVAARIVRIEAITEAFVTAQVRIVEP